MKLQGFVGPTYQGLSKKFETERAINLFPERIESGNGKDGATGGLIGTPGLEVFVTLEDGPVRGVATVPVTFPDTPDRVFAVSGGTFYEIFGNKTAFAAGSVRNDRERAFMASNGAQLAIASGERLYILTLADGSFVGPIRDSEGELVAATTVVYLDSYFICYDAVTGKLRYSA